MVKPSEKGPLYIVVSYVPMLTGEAGVTTEPTQENLKPLLQRVQDAPSHVEGTLWGMYEGYACPIFILENAAEICDHMITWAEGEPQKWFKLYIRNKGKSLFIGLLPNFYLSTERFRMAYQIRVGYPTPNDARFSLVFNPLHFLTGDASTFLRVKNRIGTFPYVGFIDLEDIPGKDVSAISPDAVIWTGPYEIGHEPYFKEYIDSRLAGIVPDPDSKLAKRLK